AAYRPAWPCVFKRERENAKADPPSGLNEEVTKLLSAMSKMQNQGAERVEGIDSVLALLRSYGPKSDWSVPHYAARAAKSSIAIGDSKRAREVLSAALQLRPDDEELGYLSRIVERQPNASIA